MIILRIGRPRAFDRQWRSQFISMIDYPIFARCCQVWMITGGLNNCGNTCWIETTISNRGKSDSDTGRRRLVELPCRLIPVLFQDVGSCGLTISSIDACRWPFEARTLDLVSRNGSP